MRSKEIKEVKQKLEAVDVERYRGAVVRARAERLWSGEVPTKRAVADEKSYATRNEIRAIEYKNEVTKDKTQIEHAFVEYFLQLLGGVKQDSSTYVRHFLSLMPKIDDDAKARLEAPISVREIEMTIEKMNNGKTPGPDGLGVAFYKKFKSLVAEALRNMLGEAYEKKELPTSFRRTHIVLIPKTDHPTNSCLSSRTDQ